MNLKIAQKLPITIVVLAIIAAVINGIIGFVRSESALETAAIEKIDAAHDGRISELTNYLNSVKEDVVLLAENHMVIDAIKQLEDAYAELGPNAKNTLQKLYINDNPNKAGEKHKLDFAPDGSAYSTAHKKYHPWFRQVMEARGYYDIFLINEFGKVVYSVYKEADYATDLVSGEWKDSDLAKMFTEANANQKKDFIAFTDFKPYAPSAGVPASFIGVPVFEHGGEFHGVLVFQMPIDRINKIMQLATGLGETGETYLVGTDSLMRSTSRFTKKGETDILKTKAESEGVKKALAGKDGTLVTIDR
ncbi:MAG: cache domain-containing protein, partial [Rhodospirillales bacterium]|nr:cache domain-containing protein [Rhodospirillales bacterium]